MPERRMTDAAWRLIAALPRGGVKGKAFRMNAATLAVILRDRGLSGIHAARNPIGYHLYSVPVIVDDFLPFATITLEER